MRFALVMLCFEGRNSDSAVHHFARGFGEGCEEAEKVGMDRTYIANGTDTDTVCSKVDI